MAKLQISTSHNSYKETKAEYEGSITPTTRTQAKKFFDVSFATNIDSDGDKDDSEIITVSGGSSDLMTGTNGLVVYEETYKYGTIDGKTPNEVLHYGINGSSLETKGDPIISSLVELLGEKVVVLKKGSEADKDKDKDKVKEKTKERSSDISKTQAEIDKGVVHHSLEKSLLEKAVKHLLSTENAKTVLVDIFAREKGAVKFEQYAGSSKQVVEVHTVVLYKQSSSVKDKYDLVVIDPSNSVFSSHLSNEDISGALNIKELNKIITPQKKAVQIYKAVKGKVGDGPGEYRDCVDIAAKLAFGFNKAGGIMDVNKLHNHPVVKSISNSNKIDESFFALDGAFRIKQTSDKGVVDKVNKLEELIHRSIKTVGAFDETMHKSLTNQRKELVKKEDQSYKHSTPSIENLVEFEKDLVKVLGETMSDQLEAIIKE